MSIRRPVLAGNWKLNHGPAATQRFFGSFLARLPPDVPASIAIFPPALSLAAARDALGRRDDVLLGVQNIHWEDEGAFTGEISAPLAREAGARLTLVGHSERRHLFHETERESALKVRAGLDAGLLVVLCVGETLEERESGSARQIVERQLAQVAEVLHPADLASLLIAYEPVWAIGTGRTASPTDASEMHTHVRSLLESRYGHPGVAIPILYGGSVKPDNAAELLASTAVDGLLIGGASLDPDDFARICLVPQE